MMMLALRWVLLAVSAALSLASETDATLARPSPGCTDAAIAAEDNLDPNGQFLWVHVPDLEPVERKFWIIKPAGVGKSAEVPAPLLLSFHGQDGEAKSFAKSHTFGSLGKQHGFISVYPEGVDDADKADDQGTTWNVGTAGDNSTCALKGVGTQGGPEHGCYNTCRAQHMCGACNWNTCSDDVLFVKRVMHKLVNRFCVDLSRVYVHGESNGGMFLHHLTQSLPGVFAAVAPWFGHPLLGYSTGAKAELVRYASLFGQTAMLQLHGRSDVTIPPGGGETADRWLYESLQKTQDVWAGIHRCATRTSPIATRWDGGKLHFACEEYKGCETGRRVMRCFYDGVHGDWPEGTTGDEITIWFLFQFRLSGLKTAAVVETDTVVV